AQRPTTASDLSPQFGIIIDILGKAGIPVYAMDGFEADDIIGTLSYAAEKAGDLCYVVTGDRDMMQLVDTRTRVLMPIKGISEMKLFDEARVLEQFGVEPDRIIELKALQGDPSDNYPGVAGVGPKTAAGLIEQYGSVKKIYENISKIKSQNPKLAEKLENGHDHAILGHQLATILRNVPFEYSFSDCEIKNISFEGWKKALESYEFKTLPKRLDEAFGENAKPKTEDQKKNINQMKLL
ncbi:MAG: 5'-3' exonuclease H3TH domain-containing protein, partial [Candidatus Levyibacteriota bacterium]